MTWAWYGMASVNQTQPHCVNQTGKTHSKPPSGTAWAQHAICESALRNEDLIPGSVKRLFHSWQGWQWLWMHPSSYLVDTASCLPRHKAARMSDDHTHTHHLMPRLKMSGVTPPLLSCGFKPQWGTILLMSLTVNILLLIQNLPCWWLIQAQNSSLKDIICRQTSSLINYNCYMNIFILDTKWQRNYRLFEMIVGF